jgi:cytochrome c554/c'-like protein
MRCCIETGCIWLRRLAREIFKGAGVFTLLVFFATACGKNSSPPFLDLPIYFTCDTHGRLEPCGCFVGQFGGLTRLKTVLDAEAPAGALRVDVGDAAAGREDYDLIEYGYMLRAFAAMNYDVLNIGAREAQFSAAQLRDLKANSPTPIISANLLDKNSRQPIFDSYRIVQRGGFRVAIIGVLDPRAEENPGAGLAVGEMESAVERSLGELRGKADLIVLLAFADEAALGRLAQEFYECKVILGGKVSQPAQELGHQNRSVIYFVTNESRALGILRLRLARSGALEVTGNEIRLLHDQIPQADAFHQLMQGYRDEIRHARLAVDDPNTVGADAVPGVRTVASYAGTEKCLACHPSAAAVWKDSPHARAFETLMEPKADADPKCIGCHTIGFGRFSGYRREFGAAKLANVGCESCHGPGSLHMRQREGDSTVNFTFRPLGAGDCAKCHYGEFSRPFNWDQFWPAIKHGKETSAPVAAVE